MGTTGMSRTVFLLIATLGSALGGILVFTAALAAGFSAVVGLLAAVFIALGFTGITVLAERWETTKEANRPSAQCTR